MILFFGWLENIVFNLDFQKPLSNNNTFKSRISRDFRTTAQNSKTINSAVTKYSIQNSNAQKEITTTATTL